MRSFDVDLVTVQKRNHLPHWVTRNALHAITFNLFDAMPRRRVSQIQEELDATRRQLLASRGTLSTADTRTLSRRLIALQQLLLDEGHGSSFMRDELIAEIVASSLLHFDGARYELCAWCVMPNHVHVIVRQRAVAISDLVHSWKGYAAKTANHLLRRSGPFWHAEYFDRAIRSEDHLRRAAAYVMGNPAKGGLTSWPYAALYPERIASVI